MPCVSRFFGIVITMNFNDHNPPHFHAEYGEYEAVFRIEDLAVDGGGLTTRARRLVCEWASIHREELLENWNRARLSLPLIPIPPLE